MKCFTVYCLPCDQSPSPVCAYETEPKRGTTLDNACQTSGYVTSGECPRECWSAAQDCPGACDRCIEGRCVSGVDPDTGACDRF